MLTQQTACISLRLMTNARLLLSREACLIPTNLRNFQRKCVRSAWVAPVKTGYIDSPFTGFKEWGEFFTKTLGNP